jgi:hypothetical protein
MIIFSTTIVPAVAFSNNPPPPQSCYPPGIDQSHTSQNPNCYGGKLPNCVSNGNTEGSAGCRNQGTCSEPDASGRPFYSTPSCPYP